MEQLIPRDNLKNYDLSRVRVENSIYATSTVEAHLSYMSGLMGLSDLMRECKIRSSSCVPWDQRKKLIEKVKRGEWLLISDIPSNLRNKGAFGEYDDIAGRRCIASGFFTERPSLEETVGPGKWTFFSIDYDGVKNTAVIFANRLGSLGDEGRLFGSDGKDFSSTTRVFIQQWVPLNDYEGHHADDSVRHRYGELRHTKQRYLEGEDKWQISGKSWHWQPVTPDVDYEYKEGT